MRVKSHFKTFPNFIVVDMRNAYSEVLCLNLAIVSVLALGKEVFFDKA